MPENPTSNTPQSHSRAGRLFLFFIGLSLALIGALFVILMARSFSRAREMRSWPAVPCLILSSEVETRVHDPASPREYSHTITFGYQWQDQRKTSNLLSLRGSSWSSKPDRARASAEAFPAGSTSTCRVNPDDPDVAVLKPDSLAPGYSIWFPGLFVVAGSVIAVRALLPPHRKRIGNPD
ncbi:MAG: DUF3592 domain-containing protein [Verrucomicrobiota bacterium JB025]|nr:DUF3592 domain-containing protein [Verrucomicrobiota bacterium JB025]